MKRLKKFNESFSKDFYTKLNEMEYREEQTKWRSSLYDMGVRHFYTSNEIKWFESKGWDDYYLRKKEISGDTRLDFFKLNPRRDYSVGDWAFNRDYFISVFKTSDDYFIVGSSTHHFSGRALYPYENLYKCDQWDGFLEFIKDLSNYSIEL
jgi:hypothetical protein